MGVVTEINWEPFRKTKAGSVRFSERGKVGKKWCLYDYL